MRVRHIELSVRTSATQTTDDITSRVAEAVHTSGVRDGLCTVTVAHTTAGVFVNENADPAVQTDLLAALSRAVPEDARYRHAEGNSPAHVKAILVGHAVTLAVRDGDLVLGTWQAIYLAEFDGPRERRATVTVLGEIAD